MSCPTEKINKIGVIYLFIGSHNLIVYKAKGKPSRAIWRSKTRCVTLSGGFKTMRAVRMFLKYCIS